MVRIEEINDMMIINGIGHEFCTFNIQKRESSLVYTI